MAIYLVSYDLRKQGQNYSGLINEIKKSPDWISPLESVWLVQTNEGADKLYNRLGLQIDKNDSILIINIGNDYQGLLPQDCWAWLGKYLQKYAA